MEEQVVTVQPEFTEDRGTQNGFHMKDILNMTSSKMSSPKQLAVTSEDRHSRSGSVLSIDEMSDMSELSANLDTPQFPGRPSPDKGLPLIGSSHVTQAAYTKWLHSTEQLRYSGEYSFICDQASLCDFLMLLSLINCTHQTNVI